MNLKWFSAVKTTPVNMNYTTCMTSRPDGFWEYEMEKKMFL